MILLTEIEASTLKWPVIIGDVLLLGSQACMSAAFPKRSQVCVQCIARLVKDAACNCCRKLGGEEARRRGGSSQG